MKDQSSIFNKPILISSMQRSPLSRDPPHSLPTSQNSPNNRRQRRLSVVIPRSFHPPRLLTGDPSVDSSILEQEDYKESSKYLLIEGDNIEQSHFNLESVVDSLAGCPIPHRLKFGECSPFAIRFIIVMLREKNIMVECLDLSGCILRDAQTMTEFIAFISLNSRSLKTLIIADNLLHEKDLQNLLENGSFPFINTLKLKNCAINSEVGSQLVETVIRMIGSQRGLVELSLSRNPIHIDAIEAILLNFTGSNLKRLNLSQCSTSAQYDLDWGIMLQFLEQTPSLEELNFNFTIIGRSTVIGLLNYAMEDHPEHTDLVIMIAKSFQYNRHNLPIQSQDLQGDPYHFSPLNSSVVLSVSDISDSFKDYFLELFLNSPVEVV